MGHLNSQNINYNPFRDDFFSRRIDLIISKSRRDEIFIEFNNKQKKPVGVIYEKTN